MTETEITFSAPTASGKLFRVHLRDGTTVAIRARDEADMLKLKGRAVKRFEEITPAEVRARFNIASGYHARRVSKILAFLIAEELLPELARIERHASVTWGKGRRAMCIAKTGGRTYRGRTYKSVRLWIVAD